MKKLHAPILGLFLLLAAGAYGQFTPVRSVSSVPSTCSPGGGSGGVPTDHFDVTSAGVAVPYFCSAPNTPTAFLTAGTGVITNTMLVNSLINFSCTAPLNCGASASLGGSANTFSISGQVSVANGGTGAATLTGLIKGNGTSPMTAAGASDVFSLFATCSGIQYPGFDGNCHTALTFPVTVPTGLGSTAPITGASDQPLQLTTQSNQSVEIYPNGTGIIKFCSELLATIDLSCPNFGGGTDLGTLIASYLSTATAPSNVVLDFSNLSTSPTIGETPFISLIRSGNTGFINGKIKLANGAGTAMSAPLIIPQGWSIENEIKWGSGAGDVAGGNSWYASASLPGEYTTGCVTSGASATGGTDVNSNPLGANVRTFTLTGATSGECATAWTTSNLIPGMFLALCTGAAGSEGLGCELGGSKETATASEVSTTVTLTISAGNWPASYSVASTIRVYGCSVPGYNNTISNGAWTIASGGSGGTTLTYTAAASGLGAATGCTVISSGTSSTISWGLVVAVNTVAQTATIKAVNATYANANANPVNYVAWSCLVCADLQNTGNFGISFVGGNINCGGFTGCVPLGNYSTQEQGFFDHINLQGFKGKGVDLEGSSFNFGPVTNLNVTCAAAAPTTAIPVMVKTQGAGNSGKPRDFEHATINCDNGAGPLTMMVYDSSGAVNDLHFEESGASGADSIYVGENGAVLDPIISPTPSNTANGATIHGIDSTNTNLNLIHTGASAANILLYDLNVSGTNTIQDDARNCTIAKNATDGQLGIYWLGAGSPRTFFGTMGSTANACGSGGSFVGHLKIGDQGTCTMSSGTCSAQSLSYTYNAAPNCFATWNGSGTLTGLIKAPSTTTTVTPASSVGTDTAVVNWACYGN